YDRKSAYLGRLYGALRGRSDAVSSREAKNAARTFANFMAYKPVKSIDQFVAGEVLDARDFGDTIKRIRELLRTVHGMELEAARLRQGVNLLEQSRSLAERYQQRWLERTGLEYSAAAQAWSANQAQYLNAKRQQQGYQKQHDTLLEEQKLIAQRATQAHQELVQLEARRQGVSVLQSKDQLESRQVQLAEQLQQGVKPLLEQDRQRDSNIEALQQVRQLMADGLAAELPDLGSLQWQQQSAAVLASTQQPVAELHQLLARDWVDLTPLDAGLDAIRAQQAAHNQLAALLGETAAANSTLIQRADRLLQERRNALSQLERQVSQTARQIKALQDSRVTYPGYVEDALNAIRQQCPEADPRVLCDQVEISDADWQMA